MWPDPAGRRKKKAKWKRTCAVSTFARAVGRGLNADRTECRPPKTAVCGRNADPSHTANHHLAAWHGCQSSRSTFRPFGILTPVKHRCYELLYIDKVISVYTVICGRMFRVVQRFEELAAENIGFLSGIACSSDASTRAYSGGAPSNWMAIHSLPGNMLLDVTLVIYTLVA